MIGVGGYFILNKGSTCPDNCSDKSCDKKVCKTCESGYGIDENMKPDTSGNCPAYKPDTSCPENCHDTTCTKKQCTKCNSGYGIDRKMTPDKDGSCPTVWKQKSDSDIKGIGTNTATSKIDDCRVPCQNNEDCVGFVFTGGMCYFKDEPNDTSYCTQPVPGGQSGWIIETKGDLKSC